MWLAADSQAEVYVKSCASKYDGYDEPTYDRDVSGAVGRPSFSLPFQVPFSTPL